MREAFVQPAMNHHRTIRYVALASLLVTAIAVTGSGVALAAQDTEQDAVGVLDGIEDLLQQVDEFLETVADLLRTIRAIGGEGGDGGGGGDILLG